VWCMGVELQAGAVLSTVGQRIGVDIVVRGVLVGLVDDVDQSWRVLPFEVEGVALGADGVAHDLPREAVLLDAPGAPRELGRVERVERNEPVEDLSYVR